MQIVIDISEEDYNIMRHNIVVNNPLCPLSQEEMVSKVANGVPLPKGHGRLIDESQIDWLTESDGSKITFDKRIKNTSPTIIEAESEDKE